MAEKVYRIESILNFDGTPKSGEPHESILGEEVVIHRLLEGRGAILPLLSSENSEYLHTSKVGLINHFDNGKLIRIETANTIYVLEFVKEQ